VGGAFQEGTTFLKFWDELYCFSGTIEELLGRFDWLCRIQVLILTSKCHGRRIKLNKKQNIEN
jgi:hypothetical protein